MAIITSLLDTDLYKFTMMYAALKTCGRLNIDIPIVQYRFKCRNKKDLVPFKTKIIKEIEAFQKLTFTKEDIQYLMSLGYFDEEFANYLNFINLNDVQVMVYDIDGELHIDIEGKWTTAILFEVPVLAIVNELYFKTQKISKKVAEQNLKTFVNEMDKIRFVDFGTRRRFSKDWQQHCLEEASKSGILISTSNVLFAKAFGYKPVGTMAHEWLQAFQVLSSELKDFQKDAFNHWMLTFRGKLDTALTDILGIDAFLNDWDGFFAKNFSCLRHDSGSPFKFIEKVRHWYIDNKTSCGGIKFLFSDGLTPKVCQEIKKHCNEIFGIEALFGIGTNFTNNCGVEPLQIVIKLNKVNGRNVIKLSDSAGKVMCEDKNLIYTLKETFNLKGY